MHLALIVQVAIGHTVAKFIFFYAQFGKKKGKNESLRWKMLKSSKIFFSNFALFLILSQCAVMVKEFYSNLNCI